MLDFVLTNWYDIGKIQTGANQMAHQTFEQAISTLATGSWKNVTDKQRAVRVVFDAVEPLCQSETYDGDDYDGEHTSLTEWLEAGEYHTDDTAKSIAKEWDALSDD